MCAAHRPVRQLSVDVARKIAAGEVIDRPQAIVRELLDNAVDSGADTISVEIAGGGIESIRIADNGFGMTKEDLKNCARPHCTSKISDAEDLMNLTTLGFRGEALASIAAVSRLSISSGSCRMTASITDDHTITTIPPVQNGKGTIVQSEGLFENFPARRVFLKRPASESLLCREVFVEKSLPRTDISFRLTVDGTLRHDLPSGVSLAERFVRALELKESSDLFSELKAEGTESDGKSKWSFNLIIGEPSIFRGDRKNIFIYVNGRRVQEYSLLQAIEYGCQGFFPNGTHPVASLFLTVDPKLVDFNIHPAKKEVRFKDISSVHHGVSSTVRTWLRSYSIKASNEISGSIKPDQHIPQNELNFTESESRTSQPASNSILDYSERKNLDHTLFSKPLQSSEFCYTHSSRLAEFAFSENLPEDSTDKKIIETTISGSGDSKVAEENDSSIKEDNQPPSPSFTSPLLNLLKPQDSKKADYGFSYLGTIFGTFLLAIYKDTFYLIDQHAAHERINFNKIMAEGSDSQELLVPYEIITESKSDDEYMESIKDLLTSSGFKTKNAGNGKWEISSIPARFNLSQKDLQKCLLQERKSPEEIIYSIAATTACRMSVKDGTILGPEAAADLAWKALNLRDPHCPHGRPVWTTLTKEELFARVRRTI